MLDLVPALPGEGQDALPVVADPDIADLFLQLLQLRLSPAVQLAPKPSKDVIPGIQLDRGYLDQRKKNDEQHHCPPRQFPRRQFLYDFHQVHNLLLTRFHQPVL